MNSRIKRLIPRSLRRKLRRRWHALKLAVFLQEDDRMLLECRPPAVKALPGMSTGWLTWIRGARRRFEERSPAPLKVSIITPLYNTDPRMLREMIESVLGQTYGNWELCLADASDGDHAHVGEMVRGYSEADPRVRYRKLDSNGGISANSNAALAMATGEALAILDHDDVLHPSALYMTASWLLNDPEVDFVYTDEANFDSDSGQLEFVAAKPDFSPHYLLGINYICHFSVFRKSLLEKAGGGFRSEFDGAQDHDLFLRLTERAKRVEHVPETLYFWRAHCSSMAGRESAKPAAAVNGVKAVEAALARRGEKGSVTWPTDVPKTLYRVRYELPAAGKVSIIIPTRDHPEDLRRCVGSILSKSTYRDFEIIVVDNGSRVPIAMEGVRVVRYDMPFNFSGLNNRAVREVASGRFLLFLNDDTEVVSPDWMEELIAYACRKEVACVGARILYPNGTVQHGGVILDRPGVAVHAFLGCSGDDEGICGRLLIPWDVSAVTAACMMVRREVFDEVNGFEERLAVAFNDVDFCLRCRRLGYFNVVNPQTVLFHCESKSRGVDNDPVKKARFASETEYVKRKYHRELVDGDPFDYNR